MDFFGSMVLFFMPVMILAVCACRNREQDADNDNYSIHDTILLFIPDTSKYRATV